MPSWVIIFVFCGLLPFLIVALLTRKTMRVTLPVCDRHKNHWLVRRLFVGLGLLALIGAGVGLAILDKQLPKDVVNASAVALAAAALVWLITAVILASGAVRAGEITNDYIDLVGVDRDFADEWKETHPDPVPRRRRRRPARRPVEDDDEDEEWDR